MMRGRRIAYPYSTVAEATGAAKTYHSSHSYDSRCRAREVSGEKEAGATGGESGARTHGPALGGEAGSVLM
jgi:hypothetical protein